MSDGKSQRSLGRSKGKGKKGKPGPDRGKSSPSVQTGFSSPNPEPLTKSRDSSSDSRVSWGSKGQPDPNLSSEDKKKFYEKIRESCYANELCHICLSADHWASTCLKRKPCLYVKKITL